MSKEDFIKVLHEHNFTYEQFLDLRDEWDRLSWQDRCDLLKGDLKKEATIEARPKVTMRYKPVCKYGKYHCINDPAYIQYAHPKWYEELSKGKTPEELMRAKWCRYCKNGSEYDDEDK